MKKIKKVCAFCEADNDLMVHKKWVHKNGSVNIRWICHSCNRKRQNNWYHKNPKNKIRVMITTMKSYAKRFGYKLTKIK
jgi:transposase-like protein